MLLSLLCLTIASARCMAADETVQEDPPADEQVVDSPDVQATRALVATTIAHLETPDQKFEAIEHFLNDKQRAAAGQAPKGWVQPTIDKYAAPGAPASFLPAPAVVDADHTGPAR